MRLKEIRDIVLYSDNLGELYSTSLDLGEYIRNCYELINSGNCADINAVKGDLTLARSMQPVLENRIKDVRDTNARINHRFRKAAKNLLDKEVYDKLMSESVLR